MMLQLGLCSEGRGTVEKVSIGEAAHRLGVSTDTVRRRISRGELTAHKDSTPPYRWEVELEDNQPPNAPDRPGRTGEGPGRRAGRTEERGRGTPPAASPADRLERRTPPLVAAMEVNQLQSVPTGRSKDGQGAPARLLVPV